MPVDNKARHCAVRCAWRFGLRLLIPDVELQVIRRLMAMEAWCWRRAEAPLCDVLGFACHTRKHNDCPLVCFSARAVRLDVSAGSKKCSLRALIHTVSTLCVIAKNPTVMIDERNEASHSAMVECHTPQSEQSHLLGRFETRRASIVLVACILQAEQQCSARVQPRFRPQAQDLPRALSRRTAQGMCP